MVAAKLVLGIAILNLIFQISEIALNVFGVALLKIRRNYDNFRRDGLCNLHNNDSRILYLGCISGCEGIRFYRCISLDTAQSFY